jgi:hypothetical protein
MKKTYTVFDMRTGEVHGRHLSQEEVSERLIDWERNYAMEAEIGTDLIVQNAAPPAPRGCW